MKMPTTKKHTKQTIAIILTVVLVGVAGYAVYAYSNNTRPFAHDSSNLQDNGSNEQENQQLEEQNAQDKQNFLDNESKQDSTSPQESNKYENKLPPINLEAKTSSDQLVVTTNLSSIASGKCTLFLTKGSQTITKAAEVIYAPEYSTCAGFSIDTAELGRGTWDISLSVKTSEATTTKTINYTL